MRSIDLLCLASLAAARSRIVKPCPCGFTINGTGSSSALFTEIFESDFLHIDDLRLDDDKKWIPQAYNVSRQASQGPFGKTSQVSNVLPNPIGRSYDWSGPGVRHEDPGLRLLVRSEMIRAPEDDDNSMVSMAEIVSKRKDILYGSFRIGMKATSLKGTCGALFMYRNDSNEIDVELLSNQQGHGGRGAVNLLIQSKESVDVEYVRPNSSNQDKHLLWFDPTEGYHEYRFDWLPDRVDFYADGKWLRTIGDNVPHSSGALHVSHWSNGNDGWTGGPPKEDAPLTISYIKAYFNSSDDKTSEKSIGLCHEWLVARSTCEIPEQQYAPDPKLNETGWTEFLTGALEKYEEPRVAPTDAPKKNGSEESFVGKLMLGLTVLFSMLYMIKTGGEGARAVVDVVCGCLGGDLSVGRWV